jgi:hypothetical protein
MPAPPLEDRMRKGFHAPTFSRPVFTRGGAPQGTFGALTRLRLAGLACPPRALSRWVQALSSAAMAWMSLPKMISGDRGRRYPRTMRSEVKHSRLTWG